MAHDLVTQVSQTDDPGPPRPSPALPPQAESRRGGASACCCFSSRVKSPPPAQKFLLPPLPEHQRYRKCLVLDLDETLVHSSFTPVPNADFVISIELENVLHRVYVRKRPGVDEFLRAVSQKFEVVVFTASLNKYADPLLDILDRDRVVSKRLFREACVQHYGNYVKDLTHLGRALEASIIIDNSPFSYMFQPENAIAISSWFDDRADRQLYELLPFLDSLVEVDDVRIALKRRADMLMEP
jgi:RNA polymerase II subunit A small phosphatase-like protein